MRDCGYAIAEIIINRFTNNKKIIVTEVLTKSLFYSFIMLLIPTTSIYK